MVSPAIRVQRVDEKHRHLRARSPCSTPTPPTSCCWPSATTSSTPTAGTHVAGFKTSLTRTINVYAKRNNLLKDITPSGDDLREGLTAIISVKLPEPQFNNQTKEKLLNPEAESWSAPR